MRGGAYCDLAFSRYNPRGKIRRLATNAVDVVVSCHLVYNPSGERNFCSKHPCDDCVFDNIVHSFHFVRLLAVSAMYHWVLVALCFLAYVVVVYFEIHFI